MLSWNKSIVTADVALLIPRPTLNSLYFFHDLFILDISQVYVQKLIAVMIHIINPLTTNVSII